MSVIYPYYDSSLELLYFTGKGDSMIRYFEYINGNFERYGNDHRCAGAGRVIFYYNINCEFFNYLFLN